ncbi:M20 family metallopeptidase [uncultured Arthrobacter sp.]|uniref:M20 metallopeptidase family protein n=1 Tax=uncultured Arthrobacter sp. TaxID=114050 RepID=UPI0028D345E1|nr:M20 family metallopeptidase [uncultured Arthrobacter sp.]
MDQPAAFDIVGAFARLAIEARNVEGLCRQLHAQPRVSGDEGDTLATLMNELPDSFQKEILAGNIGIGRLGGAGVSVALRAEMDALPVVEQTGLAWAARNGAMHACGHDVHMAAFVAVARTVASLLPLPVPLVGILQPREEVGESGARDVLRTGVLAAQRVGAVVGVHLQPALDTLTYSCTPGPVNAVADEFELVISGQPSHGAYPHHSSDALLAASAFVVSCQQIVSRNVDPTMSAVVTVGTIHAGASPNAIPEEATVRGTIRSMSEPQRDMIHTRLRQVANGVATAHACAVRLVIRKGEPILENDAELAVEIGRQLKAQGNSLGEFRSYGSDDFAFYASAARAVMIFTGMPAASGNLHASTFAPDERALSRVATAMLTGYLASAQVLGRSGAG